MTDTLASGRREANKARTRATLVRTVFDLLEAEGPEALTTERVSDVAGISRRTFFNYFPSVEAVVASAAEDVLEQVGAILRSRPQDEPLLDSVAEALSKLFTVDFLRECARVWRVVESIPGAHRFALEADSEAAESLAATWAVTRLYSVAGPANELVIAVIANACLAAVDVARRDWLARHPGTVDAASRADFLATVQTALNVIRPAIEAMAAPGHPLPSTTTRTSGAR